MLKKMLQNKVQGTLDRTIAYGLAALMGAWSLAFPSNTVAEPLHYWSVFIWAIILFLSAGIGAVGSWFNQYRIEAVALVPILGCFVLYDLAFWSWTFGVTGNIFHAKLSSGGAAFAILALCVLIAGRLISVYKLVDR